MPELWRDEVAPHRLRCLRLLQRAGDTELIVVTQHRNPARKPLPAGASHYRKARSSPLIGKLRAFFFYRLIAYDQLRNKRHHRGADYRALR